MPHRYLCDVLQEMRTCNEVRNYSSLLSLIEEVQVMGNRMEAALWDQKDHKQVHEEVKEAKKELADLKEQIKAIKD